MSLAESLLMAADPVTWAASLGVHLGRDQAEVIDARHQLRRALCACRQWGKSTVVSVELAHTALFRPGSLCVVLSPGGRQSGELVLKADQLLTRAGEKTTGDGINEQSVMLKSGSRIIGLPANPDKIVGFGGAALLVFDESFGVADSLFEKALPFVAVGGGGLLAISTADRPAGWFYQAVHSKEWWTRIHPATSCERISPETLAMMKASMLDSSFRREWLCEFLGDDEQLLTKPLKVEGDQLW